MSEDIECRELVELITPYLEGALPSTEAGLIDAHLLTCAGCTEYLRSMRLTVGALAEPSVAALPVDVRSSLLGAFRAWRGTRSDA